MQGVIFYNYGNHKDIAELNLKGAEEAMFSLFIYRIYETGHELNLDLLERQLPHDHMPSRVRFSRVRTKSIQIEAPPLLVKLGTFTLDENPDAVVFTAQAKILDIGAISICLSYEQKSSENNDLEEIGLRFSGQRGLDGIYIQTLKYLQKLLQPGLDSLEIDPQFYEDYTIYRITHNDQLPDPMPLLMGERIEFSEQMREQVLKNRLSYSQGDFAIITWDTALICEPGDPSDLRDLIEFANVQLLELHYYDNVLNKQMEKMYDDIELAETKSRYRKMRHYREIIGTRMQLIADITEVREKIENLIKITEDIYYARVYQTTLKVLRSDQWTASLNRKLEVIQQNYTLLSNEVNIQHSYYLEWIIIVLIALEFGFAILSATF
ncbi:MAG: hypothetical protein PHZ03_10590 [Syntrophomonas sp.]|nr:hypothetical protein [Syntrophomonas sp.]